MRTNLPASVSKTASFGRDCINIQGIRVGIIEEYYKTRNMDDMQRLFCTLRDQRGADVVASTVTDNIGSSKGVLYGSSPDISRQMKAFDAYLAGDHTESSPVPLELLALARDVQALRLILEKIRISWGFYATRFRSMSSANRGSYRDILWW